MSPRKRSKSQNKEYYAVVAGRIDKPTIFSSWGDAHPRVTGCKSIHGSFYGLDEALTFMKSKGVESPTLVIKKCAGETTPLPGNRAFYAVANGRRPGIYPYEYGKMKPEVEEYSGACHKHFRTHAQAEAFIEDWKISFAGVCGRVIKEGLDRELRPTDMKLDLRGILGAPSASGESEDIVKDMKEKLTLKDK